MPSHALIAAAIWNISVIEIDPSSISRKLNPGKSAIALPDADAANAEKYFKRAPPGVLPKNLYGNQLLSEVAADHFLHGMPMGRIVARIGLPAGGLQQAMHQLARIFAGAPEWLMREYRRAPVKHADETGWRNDGHSGYAWVFCTPTVKLFLFRKTRSSAVPREVSGGYRSGGVREYDGAAVDSKPAICAARASPIPNTIVVLVKSKARSRKP